MANATSTELQELYVAYFGRAADPTGLDYWTEQGITTAAFAADMYAQAEFKDAYGSKSVEAQVNQIYKNLFDREADVTGLTYWTQQINLGVLKVAEIATHLIWAAKNNDGSSDDKTALTNRTNAAVAYTAEVKGSTAAILAYQAESASPWTSGVNITEAVSYLSGIDKDTAHTAAGVTASVNTIVSNGDPAVAASAKIYNLTTKTDTGADFTGTAGNDTFNADNTGTDVSSVADTIDGGAGTKDTFNLYSDGAAAALPTVKNIEILNVYDQDANFTLTSDQGSVTTLNILRGDGLATFTVPLTVTTVGLENITADEGGITVAAAATDTAITLNLNKIVAEGNSGDNNESVLITGAKLATVTINATGSASTPDLIDVGPAKTINIDAGAKLTVSGGIETSNGSATINLTGASDVNLGAIENDIDSLAAGSYTGKLTVTGPVSNEKLVATFGSGADKFTTAVDGFATTSKFAIDAGAGEDTLVLTADADISSSDEGGRYTNFDILQRAINADYDTQYLSSTIDAASIGDGGLDNMSAAMAGDITVTADNAGSDFSLLDATGTSDVISFTASSTAGTASSDVTTVDVDGFETLNFVSNTGDKVTTTTSDRTTLSFGSASKLKTINLTGSKSAAVTLSSNAVKVTTLDASGITGGAVITTAGHTGALTITGSAVADTLNVGTVGSGGTTTVNGGAGVDTYSGTAANLGAATIDGGAGDDVVNFTDTSAAGASLAYTDTTLNGMSNIHTLGWTAAIAGDLTVTLGGWANSLASAISDNQLKISAKALASGDGANDVTIDASQLTGSNSVEMDIKDADADTSSAVGDFNLTGSDQGDKITAEQATASSDNTITVNGGKGSDTLTVKTTDTQVGLIVVDGGAGDDTISVKGATTDASLASNTITGGKGNDTITLSSEAATDWTVVAESTAANNGLDSITNFTQGSGGDSFKAEAFNGAAFTALNAYTSAPASAVDVEGDVTSLLDVTGGQDITTAAGLNAALATGGEYEEINMAVSDKALFVTAASSDADTTQHIFFGSSDASGNITTTKVATVAKGTLASWDAANFDI